MNEAELRTEFNEDIRKLGDAFNRGNQYLTSLEQMYKDTSKEEKAVKKWMLDT